MGMILEWWPLALSIIGVIVWGVRLEGRVNTQEKLAEQKHNDLKELISTQFKSLREVFEARDGGVEVRLDRIERAMNGALKGHS